ncbi:hypothetical protein ABBQ38_013442 [Trebouxia sp. C0009 RCD-2024]
MAHLTTQTAFTVPDSLSRNKRCPLTPRAVLLHSAKLRARRLHLEPPALNKTGRMCCQVKAGKPGPLENSLPDSPDISMLSPEVQQQWHIVRNLDLGAIKVKPQSHIKAVWQCDKCPAGQPHVWTARVAERTRGSNCPYCSNRRVCLHNSLATIAPEATKYWNQIKNEKSPEQVLAGSNSRAEWQCPLCKWEWGASISHRTRRRPGCPKCSAKTRRQQSQPTFAEAQPAELAEWDHERNNAKGLYPHTVTLGSGKQVHWICSCCPRGQPHRWTAQPSNRIGLGRGCPVCDGKQVCLCNSLESLYPSIAAEFDEDKNGFSPAEVMAQSHKKVWWRNAKRGSWRQTVNIRTDKRLWPNTKQGGV